MYSRDAVLSAGGNIDEEYELGDILGKGGFGTVRLARDRHGILRAVKSIPKARLVDEASIKAIKNEVALLHFVCPHPTIASLVNEYEDAENVHLVFELAAGGDLFDRITKKKSFSEAEAARFFRSMVEMIAHCHAHGVAHLDLKPENFLLSDPTDDAKVITCDFGLGTFFKDEEVMTDLVGTTYYVAPEVIRRKYGPAADTWSLGVVLFVLLSGYPPFRGRSTRETFQRILSAPLDLTAEPWPRVSEAARDLVSRMLTRDPAQRITPTEALKHPWLSEQGVAPDAPMDSMVLKRLRDFAGCSRLRKAAIVVASKHLRVEQIRGLEELFVSWDRNHSGNISLEELKEGLSKASAGNLSDADVAAVFADADLDRSGTIEYEEFVASCMNHALLEREETVLKIFAELDADGNGALTVEEIKNALDGSPLGEIDRKDVEEMVRSADINGDGVLDYEEFLKMWRTEGPGSEAAQAADKLRRKMFVDVEDMMVDMDTSSSG